MPKGIYDGFHCITEKQEEFILKYTKENKNEEIFKHKKGIK